MSLIELFKQGGFIMYPLAICSIIVWAVVVEKIWFLREFKKQFSNLRLKAEVLLKEKKFHEAKGLCHSVSPVISAPLLVVFEGPKEEKVSLWEERIGRRFKESQAGLKRFLWLLGTIGSSAPFIGLFGTVAGIIKSFESMASSGKSGFAIVAAGLSEALIATAAGILVAVIAVMTYNFFLVKIKSVELEFKNAIEDLMDEMK